MPQPKRAKLSAPHLPSPSSSVESSDTFDNVNDPPRHFARALLPTPDNSSDDDEDDICGSTAHIDGRPQLSRVSSASSAASRSSTARNLTAKAVARLRAIESCQQAPSSVAGISILSEASAPSAADSKDRIVTGLVGASVLAIESIWPALSSNARTESTVLPLTSFVREVLRRSRTSCSTLQLALYYLHQARHDIRLQVAHVADLRKRASAIDPLRGNSSARRYPSPPLSPSSSEMDCDDDYLGQKRAATSDDDAFEAKVELLEASKSPVLCGRRMFLAALMSASKYVQDKNYSNRAWAKISGLPIAEVSRNERVFLHLVQFSLYVKPEAFERWTLRLSTLMRRGESIEAEAAASSPSTASRSLNRSSSDYLVDSTTQQSIDVATIKSNSMPRLRPVMRSQSALVESVVDVNATIRALPVRSSTLDLPPPSYAAAVEAMSVDEWGQGAQPDDKVGLEALKMRATALVAGSTSKARLRRRPVEDEGWVVESGVVADIVD